MRTYKKSVLNIRSRVMFDPNNQEHMVAFADFVRYNNWKDGCPFYLEEPYADIPSMLYSKVAEYCVDRHIKVV